MFFHKFLRDIILCRDVLKKLTILKSRKIESSKLRITSYTYHHYFAS